MAGVVSLLELDTLGWLEWRLLLLFSRDFFRLVSSGEGNGMEGAESFSSTELMAPFHLSSIESIRVIIKYLKCRMSDHNNIPSMSG